MLSFLTYRTADPHNHRIVLFLHGVGEAFDPTNLKQGQSQQPRGLRHLVNHSLPKALFDQESLPAQHPLRNPPFSLVAPQLPDRDTAWNSPEHIEQILKVLATIAPPEHRKVYVVGFSKGGGAAFELASTMKAEAILAIDASPMARDPGDVVNEIHHCETPFWAIYTGYPDSHSLKKITALHEALDRIPEHKTDALHTVMAPPQGQRHKTFVDLSCLPDGERHPAVCAQATKSPVPWDWLLQH